jgi:hypothetical protein
MGFNMCTEDDGTLRGLNWHHHGPIVVHDMTDQLAIDFGKLTVFLDKQEAGEMAVQVGKALGWPWQTLVKSAVATILSNWDERLRDRAAELGLKNTGPIEDILRDLQNSGEAEDISSPENPPVYCWRVWFPDGRAILVDDPTEEGAKKEAMEAAEQTAVKSIERLSKPENPPVESAEATARETDGLLCCKEFATTAEASLWIEYFKIQYLFTREAQRMIDDSPDLHDFLRGVNQDVYHFMLKTVAKINASFKDVTPARETDRRAEQ